MKQLKDIDLNLIKDQILNPIFDLICPIMVSGYDFIKQYEKEKDPEVRDLMYSDIRELNSDLEIQIHECLDTLESIPLQLSIGERYFIFHYTDITIEPVGFVGRLVFHTKNCDCPGIFVDVKVKFTNKRNTPEFEVTLTELVS